MNHDDIRTLTEQFIPRHYFVTVAELADYGWTVADLPTDPDERSERIHRIALEVADARVTRTLDAYAIIYATECGQIYAAEESDEARDAFLWTRHLRPADLADETLTTHIERIAFAIVYDAIVAALTTDDGTVDG